MVKVHAFLKGKKSGLINVVHDEYIIDLHESELHLIKELVEIIEDFHQFRVPIYANAAISSTNWAEKKDLDLTGMGTL
jgi:DNA polymerase I-like protein with 3'-5' exonuclease and polymerase domains